VMGVVLVRRKHAASDAMILRARNIGSSCFTALSGSYAEILRPSLSDGVRMTVVALGSIPQKQSQSDALKHSKKAFDSVPVIRLTFTLKAESRDQRYAAGCAC
jgi:hypothetical protein